MAKKTISKSGDWKVESLERPISTSMKENEDPAQPSHVGRKRKSSLPTCDGEAKKARWDFKVSLETFNKKLEVISQMILLVSNLYRSKSSC
jgi:hypothetical protein